MASSGAPHSSTSSTTATSSPPPTKDMLAMTQRRINALSQRPITARRSRPIPNSYWATSQLLACEYPWTPKNPNKPKLDALLRAGVRTFIDLTEAGELMSYANVLYVRAALLGIGTDSIEYHRFPIRDRCLPESLEHMYGVLDVLRDNEARGRISAVHCRGGIGRTGMVIGCWLVDSGHAKNGEEALKIIAREWRTVEKCTRYPHSPETGSQFEIILSHATWFELRETLSNTPLHSVRSTLRMDSDHLTFFVAFERRADRNRSPERAYRSYSRTDEEYSRAERERERSPVRYKPSRDEYSNHVNGNRPKAQDATSTEHFSAPQDALSSFRGDVRHEESSGHSHRTHKHRARDEDHDLKDRTRARSPSPSRGRTATKRPRSASRSLSFSSSRSSDSGDDSARRDSRNKRHRRHSRSRSRSREHKRSSKSDRDRKGKSRDKDRDRERSASRERRKRRKEKERKKDKDKEERRSVLTGKKIKLKVKKEKGDHERDKNRQDLLQFLNSTFE
ncbi:hypothetical protein DXG01_004399 [Tephrocybe rancida]|nr:hypothetical protein DXG01_004399 [Tephrocybe rancida]